MFHVEHFADLAGVRPRYRTTAQLRSAWANEGVRPHVVLANGQRREADEMRARRPRHTS